MNIAVKTLNCLFKSYIMTIMRMFFKKVKKYRFYIHCIIFYKLMQKFL